MSERLTGDQVVSPGALVALELPTFMDNGWRRIDADRLGEGVTVRARLSPSDPWRSYTISTDDLYGECAEDLLMIVRDMLSASIEVELTSHTWPEGQ